MNDSACQPMNTTPVATARPSNRGLNAAWLLAGLVQSQVAVREDHAAEGVGDEEAAVTDGLGGAFDALVVGRLEGELIGDDVFINLPQLLPGLQRTGEVQAPQQ